MKITVSGSYCDQGSFSIGSTSNANRKKKTKYIGADNSLLIFKCNKGYDYLFIDENDG